MIAEGASHSIPTFTEGKTIIGSVLVVLCPHGLPRAIDQEVMDQMARLRAGNMSLCRSRCSQYPGEFRGRRRSPRASRRLRRMWRAGVVKHGCFSFHFFLAAIGAEHDTAAEMTLRSANALLKRQGTPSRYSGEMSHYVAGGCFLAG